MRRAPALLALIKANNLNTVLSNSVENICAIYVQPWASGTQSMLNILDRVGDQTHPSETAHLR